MSGRIYTAEEVDAAVERLAEGERLAHAREVVVHAAPGLQRILAEALAGDAYFEETHARHVADLSAEPDPEERLRRLRLLIAEEVRVGMMVGAAVGFQLAHDLQDPPVPTDPAQE